MNPAEWYKLFLTSKTLSAPSGAPLYSYKITQREYLTLTDVLKNNGGWASGWDCCFVLYATEWWRKFYDGGNWSWEPILRSINKTSLSILDRNQLVSSGFKKWKRPVNENLKGNDFIGTVVIECGLPLRVLESDHYLGDIIADLYQELGAISSIEAEHVELVKSLSSTRKLPQALQKDAFFHLLLQFVTGLVSFNEKFGFSGTDKPVERLDALSPGWRERFPLRLDGQAARNFIDQLLTGVTKVQEYQSTLMRAIHELVRHSNSWQLKIRLEIKAGLHKLPALGISITEFETLSHKLEIYVRTGSVDQRIGFAFKNYDLQGFHLDKITYHIPGHSIHGWDLYLMDPANYHKIALKIVRADLSQNSEPLIFESFSDNDSEKGWELVATGTTRLSYGIYRVVIAANAIFTSGDRKLLGNILIDGKDLTVYEVISDVGIEQNDSFFYLSFSEESEIFSYELAPQPTGFEFYRDENKSIFRGWPKIYKTREDGVVIGKVTSALEYFNGSHWATLTPEVIGKVKIRLTNGSRVLLCKTIQVLPADFTLNFNISERTVQLLHSGSFSVTIYSDAKTVIEAIEDGHSIAFKEDVRSLPEFFQIGLMPKICGTDKVLLKIPCPKQQLYFFSAAKERLSYKASLYLHDLYGSRLFISNLLPFSKTHRLKLTLLDPQQSEEISVYRSLKVTAFGNIELALVTLKDIMLSLLSMTTSIDARILVSCDDKAAIEIRQFELTLEKLDGGFMQMKANEETISCFDLQAFRLDEPFATEQVHTLIYEQEKSRWGLSKKEGLWFIFPASGIKEQFRPLAFALSSDLDQEQIDTDAITRLHEVAHFRREERFVLMDKVLDQMAADFAHPDWKGLCDLYLSLRHLPLGSQDVFARLSNHTDAIMTGALILPEEMILRLSQEFAIIWSQFPVDSWLSIIDRHYISLTFLVAAHAEQAVKARLEWIGHHLGLTSIKWVIDRLLFDEGGRIGTPQISPPIARMLIEELLNGSELKPGLRARHLEEKWPDQLSDGIINIFKALPEEVRGLLTTELVSHQKYVIYLPFILAAASVQPDLVKIPKLTRLTKFRIREVISFDEAWFAEVYNFVQGYLLDK